MKNIIIAFSLTAIFIGALETASFIEKTKEKRNQQMNNTYSNCPANAELKITVSSGLLVDKIEISCKIQPKPICI